MLILDKIKNNKSNYIFLFIGLIIFTFHQLIFLTYLNIGSFHFDFQSAFSRLTFGKIWFLKNGISIPWFTPHICCGAPYYANPQSEFYSPIQLLFILFAPLTSIKITFFLYSLLSFVGSYLLLKNSFKLDKQASLIGSSIFLFNHYFAFHFLSGHIGWGLFSIIPIFFYIAEKSLKKTKKLNSIFLIFSAGLIFSMMMHSGGSRIIMEILVSIYFLILLHLIKYKNFKIILNVGFSVFIGLLISSSKIYAAWSLVEGLPREVPPMEFKNLFSFIKNFFNFFFLVPKANVEFALSAAVLTIEEFSFNISILPLIILIIFVRDLPQITKDKFKLFLSYIVLISVFILILLNFPNSLLGSLVRKIPFISNDWISIRMLAPLIILFSFISAMMFEKISFRNKNLITILFISIIIVQNLLFDRSKLNNIFIHSVAGINKYLDLDITKSNVNKFKIDKIVTVLDEDSNFDGPKQHDFFLKNESIVFCYFSIFGYDLELLKPIVSDLMFDYKEYTKLRKDITPTRKLGSDTMYLYKGDPLSENGKNLNFINPACYLNPEDNDCKNNFLFKEDNKKELIKFLNYKPYNFKHSKIQKLFNIISIVTFIFSLIFITYFIISKFLDKKKPL